MYIYNYIIICICFYSKKRRKDYYVHIVEFYMFTINNNIILNEMNIAIENIISIVILLNKI